MYTPNSVFSFPSAPYLSDTEVRFYDLQVIKHGRICKCRENTVHLTPKEFSILWQLCKADGQIISTEKLYAAVWDEPFYVECSNTIMVHMRHVRQKLSEVAGEHITIKTIWGMGYRLECNT